MAVLTLPPPFGSILGVLRTLGSGMMEAGRGGDLAAATPPSSFGGIDDDGARRTRPRRAGVPQEDAAAEVVDLVEDALGRVAREKQVIRLVAAVVLVVARAPVSLPQLDLVGRTRGIPKST